MNRMCGVIGYVFGLFRFRLWNWLIRFFSEILVESVMVIFLLWLYLVWLVLLVWFFIGSGL